MQKWCFRVPKNMHLCKKGEIFMDNEEKKKEEKVKYAEKCAEERKANSILNAIIAKTYARHAEMSEDEFLKEIGFEGSGKTEDEAVRIAMFNLLIELTNQLIQTKNSLRYATEMLKTYLLDEKLTVEEEKGE